jgi:hypothetical protein
LESGILPLIDLYKWRSKLATGSEHLLQDPVVVDGDPSPSKVLVSVEVRELWRYQHFWTCTATSSLSHDLAHDDVNECDLSIIQFWLMQNLSQSNYQKRAKKWPTLSWIAAYELSFLATCGFDSILDSPVFWSS